MARFRINGSSTPPGVRLNIIQVIYARYRVIPNGENWPASLDPDWLGSVLVAKDAVTILDRQARRYTGQVDGQELEVLWLEHERIPARVHRTGKGYEEIVELKEIYSFAESPWPRNETAGYEVIDYADVGDKESDPFVHALLHGGGVAHGHSQ